MAVHSNSPASSVDYGESVNNPNRVAYLQKRCEEILREFPGDVLEVGVYKGGTLVRLAESVKKVCPERRVYAVDTFEGHPYSDGHPIHPQGKYSDVSVDCLTTLLKERGLLEYVVLVKGRAEEVLATLDLDQVVFAHIDCDLYTPVKYCAQRLPSQIKDHGLLFFDDYLHEHCPGSTKAIQEVFGRTVGPVYLAEDDTEWSCEIPLRLRTHRTSLMKLSNVSVTKDRELVLKNIDLVLGQGEFLSIVGASGAGKTTLLRVFAGLETSNGIERDHKLESPGAVGMLFQDDVLFPWMTVGSNLDLFLSLHLRSPEVRRTRISQLTDEVGLHGLLERTPSELSGGERRRVSLAASLAQEGSLLLLDEPTSGLDFKLKASMQELIYSLWVHSGSSFVVVTHDIEEAVYLGERVICLQDGRLNGEVPISLPFPRTRQLRDRQEFHDHMTQVRAFFAEEKVLVA